MSVSRSLRELETRIKYHPLVVHRYLRRKAERHARRGEPELRLLPFLVDPDKLAIDVGANKGIYSLVLSTLAREVIAFEPNPLMYQRLSLGLPENVTLYHLGLSDTEGEARLSVPVTSSGRLSHVCGSLRDDHAAGEVETFSVPTRPLDSFDLHDVGFIKIDVEGFEQVVLDGARQTIARDHPVLLIELEERHTGGNIRDMVDAIRALGYSAQFLYRGLLHDYATFDPQQHHDPDKPGYVRDFVFYPDGSRNDAVD